MFEPILAFYFDLVDFIIGKSLRFNALVLTVYPRSILKIEPLVLKDDLIESLLRFLNKDFVEKNEIGWDLCLLFEVMRIFELELADVVFYEQVVFAYDFLLFNTTNPNIVIYLQTVLNLMQFQCKEIGSWFVLNDHVKLTILDRHGSVMTPRIRPFFLSLSHLRI